MYEFTSTTVINSATVQDGTSRFITNASALTLQVKNAMSIKGSQVISAVKAGGLAATKASATFNFGSSNLAAGLYRLKIYVRLSGSNNSFFANDFVFKGKPLFYEFKLTSATAPATVVTNLVKTIKQFNLAYGTSLLVPTANSANLILTGTEYMIFDTAEVQLLTAGAETFSSSSFVTSSVATVTKVQGSVGRGTYDIVIRNLKLPTYENVRFASVEYEQMPIVGEIYTQYTIVSKENRGVMGTATVGDTAETQTTAVFFVKSSVVSAFDAALYAIGVTPISFAATTSTADSKFLVAYDGGTIATIEDTAVTSKVKVFNGGGSTISVVSSDVAKTTVTITAVPSGGTIAEGALSATGVPDGEVTLTITSLEAASNQTVTVHVTSANGEVKVFTLKTQA